MEQKDTSTIDESRIELTGLSGTKYLFNLYTANTHLAADGGVFVAARQVSEKANRDEYSVIHIGSTERFPNLLTNDKMDGIIKGVTHVFTLIENNNEQRERIEKDLIDNYKSRTN